MSVDRISFDSGGLFLAADVGNSSVKLSLWSCGRMVDSSRFCAGDAGSIRAFLHGHRIDGAAMSSVGEGAAALADTLRPYVATGIMMVDNSVALPIKVSYRTPATLGVDRVCAAVGAAALEPGKWLVVVDAGTAVTVDVVSCSGEYAGGDIAPGIGMQLDALHRHTSRLPQVEPEGELPSWGVDTETAIRCGVVRGVGALVADTARSVERMSGERPVVFITGGDASLVEHVVAGQEFECHVVPELVGLGLNAIYNYNLKQK